MQYSYVTPLLEIPSVILVAGQIKSKPYIWPMPMPPVSSLVFLNTHSTLETTLLNWSSPQYTSEHIEGRG